MKALDPGTYNEAVRRYHDDLEAAGGGTLRDWIAYGVWLAEALAPGRRVTVDHSGLASDFDDSAAGHESADMTCVFAAGSMLVHLPSSRKERALALAMPAEPTAAQSETADLLGLGAGTR